MKTFLRRPGNKSSHLTHIIPLLPKEINGTYIEPFLGTGALFLHLLPTLKKWIINDLNTNIINVWKLVKNNPHFIIKEITTFKKQFLPLNNEYKLIKCQNIAKKLSNNYYKTDKKYAIYLILVYCSFNGSLEKDNTLEISSLYTNIYNNKSCHIFTEKYLDKLLQLSIMLKKGKIYNTDYKNILKKAKEGHFVFIDPPYIEDKKYAFQYNAKESQFNINELKEEVEKLDKIGVKWMMTQIYTKDIMVAFSKYRQVKYINKLCFAKTSTPKTEVIITNY